MRPSPATAPSRLHALDGLRAVAALSVVVYHAWLYTLPVVTASARDTVGDYVLHELRLGLVLFFVLSGYLLRGRPSTPDTAPPRGRCGSGATCRRRRGSR